MGRRKWPWDPRPYEFNKFPQFFLPNVPQWSIEQEIAGGGYNFNNFNLFYVVHNILYFQKNLNAVRSAD
jgi:hypothetical protein